MFTKFGLTDIGLSGDLEVRMFHFGTEIKDGHHVIFFFNKYNLLN